MTACMVLDLVGIVVYGDGGMGVNLSIVFGYSSRKITLKSILWSGKIVMWYISNNLLDTSYIILKFSIRYDVYI